MKEFLREEISIIRSLNHPNVVKFKEVFESSSHVHIVMEHVDGGDLYLYCKSFFMDSSMSKKVMYQLIKLLQTLATHGIVHRDIKPNNILL